MTTFSVPEDAELAQALTDAARHASPDAIAGLAELRNTASVGNGFRVAHLHWHEREPVSRALRATADAGHPLGDRLRGVARALDDSLRAHAMNNPGFPAPPPEVAPEPAPEPAPAPEPVPAPEPAPTF